MQSQNAAATSWKAFYYDDNSDDIEGGYDNEDMIEPKCNLYIQNVIHL